MRSAVREELMRLEEETQVIAALWGRSIEHTRAILQLRGLRDLETQSVCRDCGCTDADPCEGPSGPCSWAGGDLCSFCSDTPKGGAKK